MKFKVSIWVILTILGLASHEVISELIRPIYGIGEGVIPYLLGVAPNFIAAGLIFPFSVLSLREYYPNENQQESRSNLNRWFWIGLGLTLIALITWEFMQKTGNLIFDLNDILATLLGGLFAVLLFYLIAPKQ